MFGKLFTFDPKLTSLSIFSTPNELKAFQIDSDIIKEHTQFKKYAWDRIEQSIKEYKEALSGGD
jgi:hypothetical protein